MGRLTIEQAIEYWKIFLDEIDELKATPGTDPEEWDKQEKATVAALEALVKQRHYKDLEEAGRLIELPCAVGDTVYRTILDKVYEYTVGSFLVDENGAWSMSLLFEQEEKKFAANMDCDNLGKTVFLTKEEAEAKLKELEGVMNEREKLSENMRKL